MNRSIELKEKAMEKARELCYEIFRKKMESQRCSSAKRRNDLRKCVEQMRRELRDYCRFQKLDYRMIREEEKELY